MAPPKPQPRGIRAIAVIEQLTGVRLSTAEALGVLKVFSIEFGYVGKGKGRRVVLDEREAEALGASLGDKAHEAAERSPLEKRVDDLESLVLELGVRFDKYDTTGEARVLETIRSTLNAPQVTKPRVLVVGPMPSQGHRLVAMFADRVDVVVLKPEQHQSPAMRRTMPDAELCVLMTDFISHAVQGAIKARGYPALRLVSGGIHAASAAVEAWLSDYALSVPLARRVAAPSQH